MLIQLFSNPGSFDFIIAFYWLIGLIIAISFHEFAHAWVADRLGDLTPRYMGRVTIDPLAHLDPFGTLLILLVGFGWGKPVIFNPLALKNPAAGAALISLAGPLTNFIIALIFCQLLRFHIQPSSLWMQIAYINLILGIFNLLPISPLDGEKIVGGMLPPHYRLPWASVQQYGIILLIAAIFTIGPLLSSAANFLLALFSGQIL